MFTVLVFILSLSAAYSTAGLKVVLANQNPDPITPGNFVELNVKISNSGDTAVKDTRIRFVENNNFKIAAGKDTVKEIGQIPAYSNLASSESYVIAKFLVKVAEDTPLGQNPVQFVVESSQGDFDYEFDVTVQDQNPTIVVDKFNIETTEAGKSSKLTMEIENTNSISLNNIVVSLGLNDVEDKVLSAKTGSNQKVIRNLPAGEKATIEFDIAVSPNAEAKPYLFPVNIDYEDSLENSFSTEVYGSVRVYSTPMVIMRLDSQEKYNVGNGRVTLAISNPGTSRVKGTQIEILPSDSYEILDGSFQYVGDLNPDDFQTIQLNTFVKDTNAVLKVKLTYLDSYNEKSEEIIEVPLKVYNEEELNSLGLAGGGSNTSYIGYIIVALIVGFIAFIVGKKRGYKKAKSRKA